MKSILHFFLWLSLLLLFTKAHSQNKISGKSQVYKFDFNPVYEKGVPPKLSFQCVFEDDNENGVLEPFEGGKLLVTILNSGVGLAQGIQLSITPNFYGGNVYVENPTEIYFLKPDEKIELAVPVKADGRIEVKNQSFDINVTEQFGNNPDMVNFTLNQKFKRGLPPSLFAEMSFEEQNGNGFLDCAESALLKLTIINKGEGKAQGLKININDTVHDNELSIGKPEEIVEIAPKDSVIVNIQIIAGSQINTAEHRIEIDIIEHFGYDMDPILLIINTLEFQRPEIVYAGFEVLDYIDGVSAIVEDGQLQAGEMAPVKIILQNVGLGKAENIKYKVVSKDKNIYIENGEGTINSILSGEIKDFNVTISPNKRVESDKELPIYLTVTEETNTGNLNNFQLPLFLNIKPPAPQILAVQANIEELSKQIARFEYTSNKFKTNIGRLIDINDVKPSKTKHENSVAVIFGIENYINLPSAPYAGNDADIIMKYFRERLGIQQIVVFKNDNASGFVFDNVFNSDNGELQKAVVKGQTNLFVFYSGHGIPSKDGKNIYLFPSDGKIERVELQGYNLNDLYSNLEKLGAKSTTVFIDACFSGSSRSSEKINVENLIATKGVKVIPKLVSPWERDPNFSIFNSSGPNETSLGFDPSQTGLFTYYLCAGLQGEADENNDNKITNGELGDYISKKVIETSKKVYGKQSPEFYGNKDHVLVEF